MQTRPAKSSHIHGVKVQSGKVKQISLMPGFQALMVQPQNLCEHIYLSEIQCKVNWAGCKLSGDSEMSFTW